MPIFNIAYAQHWEWAHYITSNDVVDMQDVCVDSEGNCYTVCTTFDNASYLGNTIPGSSYSTALLKIDPSGNLIFSKSILGVSPMKIKIDRFKNIYIAGVIGWGFVFDNTWYSGNSFLIKLDSLGNDCWVRTTDARIFDMDISANDNIAVCGDYTYTTSFCGQALISNLGYNLFVTEVTSTGVANWNYSYASTADEFAFSLAYDEQNNIAVAGNFYDTLIVGSQTYVTNPLNLYEIYLIKIGANGIPLWSKVLPDFLAVADVECSINSQIFLSAYGGTANDTIVVDSILLPCPSGTHKYFIACFDSLGNAEWANRAYSDWWIRLDGLTVSETGELFLGGASQGDTLIMDNYLWPLDDIYGSYAPFLIKYRSNGSVAYPIDIHGGGLGFNFYSGVAVDQNNNVYYSGAVDTYSLQLGEDTVLDATQVYSKYGFIAKYNDVNYQDIPIHQGWNIISGYLEPYASSMADVMAEIDTTINILKDDQGDVYWPQYSLNQIGNWDIEEGYQIKVNDTTRLRLKGELVNPDSTIIQIDAGWHIISYPRYLPIPVEDVFNQYANSVVLMKNGNGQVYWPQYNLNLIGDLLPGQGYQLKALTGLSLEYPAY